MSDCPLSADLVADLLARPPLPAVAGACGDLACHLVGGAIRDRVLGVPARDLDLVVERRGRELARRLERQLGARRVDLGGERFASFRLLGDGWTLDLWDREGASLESDLERRDFTVNSVAVALADGRLRDPLGGLDDLASRTLRANSAQSFAADPLRVLRLVRFAAAEPPFSIDPPTLEGARRAAPRLAEVAAERVREELQRILDRATAEAAPLLARLDLYPGLWLGFEPPPPGLAARPPDFADLDRRLERPRRTAPPAAGERGASRHALLLAALADGGGPPAADLLGRLRSRGWVAAKRARRVAALLAAGPPPADERRRRRYLHRHGAGWRAAAAVAAGRGDGLADRVREERLAALERLATDEPEVFDPPPLLDGHDVERLTGVAPGPELGRILGALRAAQVEGRVAGRAAAERLVRRLAADGVRPDSAASD